ncbi:MAG: amidohydrolase family protein [Pyrinomonadaceae bacterium]|nr:amidohydrolase family protein [Pyrinomonadaceae bacterium]
MPILRADHVVPVASPPINDGAVVVANDSILAVGPFEEISESHPSETVINHSGCAIIPGLVNCHMHLELTGFRGRMDRYDRDFGKWLIEITRLRKDHSDSATIKDFALLGACEAAASGVTCVGDIGRLGFAGAEALESVGLRGIVFQETEFSPSNSTAETDFELLRSKFEDLACKGSDLIRIGLSPHAPFTVSRELFERITEYSLDNSIPLSIHAAESQAESELMSSGKGMFAEMFMDESVGWEIPYQSTIAYFEEIGVLEAKPLLAHVINVNDEEIGFIAKRGATVAHCPRSNSKFGHGVAPLGKFVDAGITVGVGSDSMASNNVCDMLSEVGFAGLLARTTSADGFLSAEELLHIATLGGAAALGLEDRIGSLEPGKQADLAIIKTNGVGQSPVSDICSTIVFSTNASSVKEVLVAGQSVYTEAGTARVEIKAVQERVSAAFNC